MGMDLEFLSGALQSFMSKAQYKYSLLDSLLVSCVVYRFVFGLFFMPDCRNLADSETLNENASFSFGCYEISSA